MNPVWDSEFSVIENVRQWNANILPWMKERGDEFKRYAHAEAKKRGYEFHKYVMEYRVPWRMFATRGRNLIAVGWQDGILRCIFASSKENRIYRYGDPEQPVPEAEFKKLLSVPFPDKIFVQVIKDKFPVQRETPTLG